MVRRLICVWIAGLVVLAGQAAAQELMALVIAPSVPANTPQELVERARKQDGGVSYAAAAPGSSQHVAAELMVGRAGMKATHVPYRGSSAAMADLPTREEAGFPDFAIEGWYGIFAPARTPRPIVDKLSADINKVLREPEVDGEVEDVGLRSDRHDARGFRRAPEG